MDITINSSDELQTLNEGHGGAAGGGAAITTLHTQSHLSPCQCLV
jgi:hypothetical protein